MLATINKHKETKPELVSSRGWLQHQQRSKDRLLPETGDMAEASCSYCSQSKRTVWTASLLPIQNFSWKGWPCLVVIPHCGLQVGKFCLVSPPETYWSGGASSVSGLLLEEGRKGCKEGRRGCKTDTKHVDLFTTALRTKVWRQQIADFALNLMRSVMSQKPGTRVRHLWNRS